MKKLKVKNTTPPGGWRYVDPDTGFKYDRPYRTFSQLLSHVRRYRSQNGLSRIPRMDFVIEAWLCEQPNMEGHCKEWRAPRTIEQFLKGGRAATKITLKKEEAYTTQEVAEARAAVCVTCRHNKFSPTHNKLEFYTDKYITAVVGDRTTSLDSKLNSCEICTCPLKPKVHIAQDIVEESLTKRERRQLAMGVLDLDGNKMECWQMSPIEGKKDAGD